MTEEVSKPIAVNPNAALKPIAVNPNAALKPIAVNPNAALKPIVANPNAALKPIAVSPNVAKPTDANPNAALKPIAVSPNVAKPTDANPNAALSPNDPTSYSNPEDVRAERFEIHWNVDFKSKTITGSVTYHIIRKNPAAEYVILDTKDITIKSITAKTGKPLEFTIGEEVKHFGKPLRIKLPELDKLEKGVFTITYQTSGTTCLMWLPRELTNDKTHPYLFSQGQAINVRSLLPCQDTPSTKATYSSQVTVSKEFLVLMSALPNGSPTTEGAQTTFKFEQSVPISSYLVAIAIGKLVSKKIGPRSTVFAEPSLIEAAAYEFGETEEMIQTAEKLAGRYVWGEYNILLLPGSFAFGGMENPCLTFTTPTLLSGDRSLTDVLAHEIAHSWTGNLVTFKTYEHFWLSEGFTMYLERRILGMIHGEPYRQFQSIAGLQNLEHCIKNMGSTNKDTWLVPDLKGIDPDEIFSDVPYEKGYTLLYYLEVKVGGPAEFARFFKHYIVMNKYKSIDTNTFKQQFIDYFTKANKLKLIQDVEWDKWFYTPGMPFHENTYDQSLVQTCINLKNKWSAWDSSKPPCPFQKKDLTQFVIKAPQLQEFLTQILDEIVNFDLEKVKAMQTSYEMNSIKNCEIRFRWYRICIAVNWIDQLPAIISFITSFGRHRFILPIYRDLYGWEKVRKQTLETYLNTKAFMLPSTQLALEKILKLKK